MPEPELDLHRARRIRAIFGAAFLALIIAFLVWYFATNWQRGDEPPSIVGMID